MYLIIRTLQDCNYSCFEFFSFCTTDKRFLMHMLYIIKFINLLFNFINNKIYRQHINNETVNRMPEEHILYKIETFENYTTLAIFYSTRVHIIKSKEK